MRAIVAESNVVTRVTLTRILERAGFEVEELQDELAAACLIYQPDPPELALLALDTLLVDFEQVCEAMRAAKPDVFIVALVPEARRNELLRVLRHGADDFVIKPVTIQEADARVFVIQQTLAARGIITLPERPDEAADEAPAAASPAETAPEPLEALIPEPEPPPKKKKVAEPTPAAAAPAEPPAASAPAEVAAPAEATPPPEPTLIERLAAVDFTDVFGAVFTQLGLGPVKEVDPASSVPYYTAWAPLIVREPDAPGEAMWLNLRIDLERTAATRLYHVVMKKATLEEEALLKLLRDIVGLVQDGLQRLLLKGGRLQVYVPLLPSAVHTERFPSMMMMTSKAGRQRQSALALARDVQARLAATVEPIQAAKRSLVSLRRLDILASPVQTKGDHVMLLRDGILLNDAYINKIRGFIQSHNLEREVFIYRPPSGLAVFLYNLVAEED